MTNNYTSFKEFCESVVALSRNQV